MPRRRRGDQGEALLHPDNIEHSAPEKIVQAVFLHNARALEFVGRLDSEPARRCAKCGTTRPVSEFELAWQCVYCDGKRRHEPLAQSLAITHSYCTCCNEWKPKADFTARVGVRKGTVAHCKVCRNGARVESYAISKFRKLGGR